MRNDLSGRNAVSAIRASSVKQGTDGDSPEAQNEQIQRFAKDKGIHIVKTLTFLESASKVNQPMQGAINFCKDPKNKVDLFIIKSIDRFTRGGHEFYGDLKRQLEQIGVTLIDIYGIIGTEKVNTLGHLGFEYGWSVYSPTHKSEILEAERAKDEMRDIMSRVIGAEIRYTQLGYWMRQPPDGMMSVRIDTQHGKRTILKEHPDEGKFVKRMFELRAQGLLGDSEIVKEINDMGYMTRTMARRSKRDPTKVIKVVGGVPLTVKKLYKIMRRVVYAGVICEKWTNNEPIMAAFDGLISIDTFNRAQRGRFAILKAEDGTLSLYKKPSRQKTQYAPGSRNPEFPYRKFVACPKCGHALLGSASRGKSGKYYSAYHCSSYGHYYRVAKADLEQSIMDFTKHLVVSKEQIDRIEELVLTEWENRHIVQQESLASLQLRIDETRDEINLTVGKIKTLTSPTAIKYIEEELMRLEQQLLDLEEQKTLKEAEKPVDMASIMKRVRYFLEHIDELLIKQIDPIKKAQFFGALFEKMPTITEIKAGTPAKALLSSILQMTETQMSVTTDGQIQLGSIGGPSGTRTQDTLLKRQVL